MKKIFFFMGVLFGSVLVMGQVVPLKAANWDYRLGAVEFADGASEVTPETR